MQTPLPHLSSHASLQPYLSALATQLPRFVHLSYLRRVTRPSKRSFPFMIIGIKMRPESTPLPVTFPYVESEARYEGAISPCQQRWTGPFPDHRSISCLPQNSEIWWLSCPVMYRHWTPSQTLETAPALGASTFPGKKNYQNSRPAKFQVSARAT